MFRDAYEHACKFTFPVVQFMLTVEGECSAGAAAFVVIRIGLVTPKSLGRDLNVTLMLIRERVPGWRSS
jgi:hypothetical protein